MMDEIFEMKRREILGDVHPAVRLGGEFMKEIRNSKKPYTVGWSLPNGGNSGEIKTCCVRDTATRLSMLGRVVHLEQPDELPQTCKEHSYE